MKEAEPKAEQGSKALGAPRLRGPDREQILPAMPLEQLLEDGHAARRVWAYAQKLDISALYDLVRSRQGTPGRAAIDPLLLLALWLYATLTGVVSARHLADLCQHHHAFRWLCGGVSVNYHTLSDFRVEHADFLDDLLTQSVDVLRAEGMVPLDRTATDGVRVRASAGAASFHRRATLEKMLRDAEDDVECLRQELDALKQVAASPGPHEPTPQPARAEVVPEQEVAPGEAGGVAAPTAAELAAQQRAAAERVARAEQALARLPEMEAKKTAADKDKARTSTTDPEASVMKMANGGYGPAYNIQYSTDCENGVIVGVEVLTLGSDQGQLAPMLAQVEERFGQKPKETLADGGYVKLSDIEEVQNGGCKVYAPVPAPKKEGVDRYAPHQGDGPETIEWRQRMPTAEAKEIYKERASTAELVNAQARNRGLIRLLVRGVAKVKAVALWYAVVHNMARAFSLLPLPVDA